MNRLPPSEWRKSLQLIEKLYKSSPWCLIAMTMDVFKVKFPETVGEQVSDGILLIKNESTEKIISIISSLDSETTTAANIPLTPKSKHTKNEGKAATPNEGLRKLMMFWAV